VGRHLLVISCSKKKNRSETPLPAIERYTGAWYQVINKIKRENRWPKNLDMAIISAKYGFLKPNDIIEYYDLPMDKRRAQEINQEILIKFRSFSKNIRYDSVFINLGKNYLLAVKGIEDVIPRDAKIIYAQGRVGERKSRMKEWILSLEKTK